MDTRDNAPDKNDESDKTPGAKINREEDLPDSKRDQERLQPDEAILDLPEVKDIPGQENITVPPMGELGDTTASSDDEEGRGVV